MASRDPILSIFSPELVCASVCQSSCRATSTVLESRTSSGPLPMKPLSAAICERSRLSHWYSEPISPSLSLLFSVSGFVNLGWSALFYEQLCLYDADKLVRRRENISPVSSFLPPRLIGRLWQRNFGRPALSSKESVCSTVREFNYGFIVIFFDGQIGMLLEVVF